MQIFFYLLKHNLLITLMERSSVAILFSVEFTLFLKACDIMIQKASFVIPFSVVYVFSVIAC